MIDKKVKGIGYLLLGLIAFAGFWLDIVILKIGPHVFGIPVAEYGVLEYSILSATVSMVWWIMSILLTVIAKKRMSFSVMNNRVFPGTKQLVLAGLMTVAVIAMVSLLWDGFKPAKEFMAIGATRFVFQYIYYFSECALIMLTVIFGQQFGEMVFENTRVPYGGFLLAFTWGLMHILTQGSLLIGLYSFVMALIYGSVYMILRKNTVYAYLFIAAMFIL